MSMAMKKIICDICERGCAVSEGQTGSCYLYELQHGQITERFPDRYLVACPISIETARPGRTLPADQLNTLNPEIIFISAFISSPVEDFYNACIRLGVTAEAVRHSRIYTHPAPGWDFGSPRWILGLMLIASILHPNEYHVDIQNEANLFYEQFYGETFSPESPNRSFSKPSSLWRWSREIDSADFEKNPSFGKVTI
jgi:hypothetical protein